MEPLSTLAAGYTVDKLIEVTESTFRKHVIERWGRWRAQQFYKTFCDAVADTETTEEELRIKLDELLSDERRSEILFDAYRSVCLTRSKNIGPRVIALLTAQLVIAGTEANDRELSIFSAAEELTDSELIDFAEFATKHFERAAQKNNDNSKILDNGALSISMGEEVFTTTWHSQYEISVAPIDLINDVGSWAAKLKRHGLVSDDVKEHYWKYEEDSERHIDEDGAARQISWWLFLAPESKRFADMIKKVSK